MKTYRVVWLIEDEIEAVNEEHAEAIFWTNISDGVYDGEFTIEELEIKEE